MSPPYPENLRHLDLEERFFRFKRMKLHFSYLENPFPVRYQSVWQEAPELQIEGATEQGCYPPGSEVSAAVRRERDLHISRRMERHEKFVEQATLLANTTREKRALNAYLWNIENDRSYRDWS